MSRAHRRLRRTWPQRLLISFNAFVAVACLGAAAGLAFAIDKAGQVARVTLPAGVLDPVTIPTKITAAPGDTSVTTGGFPLDSGPAGPAENYLVVGSDSRSCIDPKSPYAGAFLAE